VARVGRLCAFGYCPPHACKFDHFKTLKLTLGCQKFGLRQQGDDMIDRAADFTGSIPAFYDQGLGPIFFA
jgi:hypothetical protein